LFLAVVVAVGFGQSLQAVLHDLRHWYQRTITADFLVRGSIPDTSFLRTAALPETLADELARLPDVDAVDRLAFLPAQSSGGPVLVLARTFAAGRPLPLDLREGEPEAVRRELTRGEAVLGSGLARRLNLQRGSRFTLTTREGLTELRVAGTAAEYAGGGEAIYLEWNTARRLLDVRGAQLFLVRAAAGTAPRLEHALQRFCETRHLLLQTNAELHGWIDQLLGRISGALYALLALVLALAAFGIANTLVMNVRDQTFEFGVLRALGMKPGQLVRTVLTQALLLGGISAVPGALVGVALGYAINRGSASWTASPVAFTVDPIWMAGCCALALLVTAAAALIPARRVAGLAVVAALQRL
jgi:putative ABC transport system permease protein